MKYYHTMVRVSDLDDSLDFYCNALGMKETRRFENEKGRFTLVFVAAEETPNAEIELTYNWDPEEYTGGRNFGHLAFHVEDIYEICQKRIGLSRNGNFDFSTIFTVHVGIGKNTFRHVRVL